jgi:hypothetical protein
VWAPQPHAQRERSAALCSSRLARQPAVECIVLNGLIYCGQRRSSRWREAEFTGEGADEVGVVADDLMERVLHEIYRKMVQNLVWATAYNLVAIPIAAGVLVPWGLDLPMAVGAIAMSASTVIVAANAQLLRRLRLRPSQDVTPSVAALPAQP